MFETNNIEGLLDLFNQTKKRDVDRYCRELVIYDSDFSALIFTAQAGALAPFKYANYFNDKIPKHLHLKEDEIVALSGNMVGPLRGKSKKAITKVFQISKDRRCLAAHLFYTEDYRCWHMFYFDQRDNDTNNNHWEEGPHIHYLSDLWSHNLLDVWNKVLCDKTNFGSALHIRFQNG